MSDVETSDSGDRVPCPPGHYDLWWRPSDPNDPLVNEVTIGIAHHHATGHPGSGSEDGYDCEVCNFAVENGRVIAGGYVRFKEPDDA